MSFDDVFAEFQLVCPSFRGLIMLTFDPVVSKTVRDLLVTWTYTFNRGLIYEFTSVEIDGVGFNVPLNTL